VRGVNQLLLEKINLLIGLNEHLTTALDVDVLSQSGIDIAGIIEVGLFV
jgi:hypothetical protein